jgi:hypothetical protein
MKKIVALLIGLALLGSSEAGWTQPKSQGTQSKSQGNGPEQVAYGAGSFLTTLVYAPFKATFCILGAVGSGIALPIAGSKTAGNIYGTTCTGTWVITPDNLKGKDRVKFISD